MANNKLLKRISFKNLRNGAHLQMLRDIVARILGSPGATAMLPNTLFTQFLQAVGYEDESFKVMRGSKFTEGLDALDRQRDRVFRGLVHTVKGLMEHFNEDTQAAARQVMKVLSNYGNVAELPHDEETASLVEMCKDLKGPAMQGLVEQLGLTEWVDKLSELADSYSMIESKRIEELAGHAGYNMQKARVEADRVLRMLLNYLEIMVSTDPKEALEKLVDELNVIFKHYEQAAKLEHGGSEGGEEEIVAEEVIITEGDDL